MSDEKKPETRNFVVGNTNVEMRTFITARQMREIDNILLDSVDINQAIALAGRGGDSAKSGINTASLMNRQDDKKIETVVVSVNGKVDGILEAIMELPSIEYKAVLEEINSVIEGKKNENYSSQ